MKGYRTIVVNLIAVLASVAALFGLEVTQEEWGTVTTGVLAVVNIIMRCVTDTPVGKKSQGGYALADIFPGLALLGILGLGLVGCSAIEKAGETLKENPVVADLVVRQAVFRYIEAGDTHEEQIARGDRVCAVVTATETYLIGSPEARVAELLTVIDSQIHWDALSRADRLLVEDVMLIVQLELERRQQRAELSTDAVLGIEALLNSAKKSACFS